jgi:hypothetical protein
MRADRERPRRSRATEERDEFAPPDFEHRLPPDRTIEIGGNLSPLCAPLKAYHSEGAADSLLHYGQAAALRNLGPFR